MSRNIIHKIYYGNLKGDIHSTILNTQSLLTLEVSHSHWGNQVIATQLVGAYNRPNVEVALCVGNYFGIPFDRIKQAIEAYSPDNARSQLLKKGNNTIVLDAYNANPSSMMVAIDNFKQMEGDQKWAFLGGMMELGEDSVIEHKAIVHQLEVAGFEKVILVGGDFLTIKSPFNTFVNSDEAAAWLREHKPENITVLIKGSRSMKMEKLLDAF
jgi:UDP-N-acetylmuramoyl-tripeptide--D-alanyl-D-alanine ligase